MIIQFICRAILLGVPLLYGSTGEIVTEKSFGFLIPSTSTPTGWSPTAITARFPLCERL